MHSGLSWWLPRVGRYPLLTPAQELTYGRQVQEWRTHPDGPEHCPPEIRRRGIRARERFVRANLRLVVTIAKRFRRLVSHHAFDDLVQAGNQGLIDAVERFDPSRGYRFSTYAAYWIQMRVTTHIERSERTIRLPTTISPKAAAIPRTIRKLFCSLGREPTRQDLADALGMSVLELDRIATVGKPCVSLDAVAFDDNDGVTTIGQLIASPAPALLTDEITALQHRLINLPERSQHVLRATYGIGRGVATIPELAREMGVTQRETRALLDQALTGLRCAMDPDVKQLQIGIPAAVNNEPAWLVQIRGQLGPLPPRRKRRDTTSSDQFTLPICCS
jgi:RNA polymerase sigma factor (sigma-70 family)